MDKNLLKIINERQLVSVMNSSKWRKFIEAITSISDFEPLVRYRLITNAVIDGFSLVWWDEILEISSTIQWLEVDPKRYEKGGRLLPDTETDFSREIQETLNCTSVPYTIEKGLFRIWGYIEQSEHPDFLNV